MVNIGRGNIRSRMTPSGQGMARRIDTKLDAVVDAYAARFKTALAIDGVVAFIFNKHLGVIPCTCRGFQNLSGISTHEMGLTGFEATRGEINVVTPDKRISQVIETVGGRVKQVSSLNATNIDDYLKDTNETIVEKIENNNTDDDGFTDDEAIDVLDALFEGEDAPIYNGDGDPMKHILSESNMANSSDFPYTPSMVNCPICLGTGTVDSWRLYNGERIVLDASNAHNVEIYNDVDLDDGAQPVTYSVYDRSAIRWTNVALPTSWRHFLRLQVFNGKDHVPITDYQLYLIHPSNPDVKNPIDYNSLNQLNNSPLLASGNKVAIELQSTLGPDAPLVFTHVELMFSTGHLIYCQVPEVDQQNEDEFIDWNLNLTVEMPSDIEMKENSYLVEGKYKRVWKVTNVNRKLTAQGKSFGYSVGVRAIHSFERSATLLNILGKPRNPYHGNQLTEMNNEGEY